MGAAKIGDERAKQNLLPKGKKSEDWFKGRCLSRVENLPMVTAQKKPRQRPAKRG